MIRIPERVKAGIRNYPRIHRVAEYLHHKYSSLYVRLLIWRYCSLKPTTQRSVEIIEVDPEEIRYINDPGFRRFEYEVCEYIGGSWDKDLPLFKDSLVYESFHGHFVESKEWESTEYYNHLVKRIESGRSWHGCVSKREIKARLSKYDRLHNTIRHEGYKTQKELQNESGPLEPLSDRQPEMHEITVDIGRSGDLILEDGRHRLAITQILGLDSVPVRVLVRQDRLRTQIND